MNILFELSLRALSMRSLCKTSTKDLLTSTLDSTLEPS